MNAEQEKKVAFLSAKMYNRAVEANPDDVGGFMAQKLYEVHMSGSYYAFVNGQKSVKQYELTFIADAHAYKAGLTSVFRNALTEKDGVKSAILKKMLKAYPDYKRFKTHILDTAIDLANKNKPMREVSLMNRAQMIQFINSRGYPIDPVLFPKANELRQALRDYKDDQTKDKSAFKAMQDKRLASMGETLIVSAAIERLNAEDFDVASYIAAKPNAPTHTAGTQFSDITDAPGIENELEFDLEGPDFGDSDDTIPELDDDAILESLLDGV